MATPKENEVPATEAPVQQQTGDVMVTIRLPRDEKDKEDKVVWVNARRFLIKRGVTVQVPESVALILQQEEDSLERIYDFNDKNAN